MGFLLAWAVVPGCAHYDINDPAPGFVDISKPPPIAGQRHVIPAKLGDEGMLMINSGIFGSFGLRGSQAGLEPWATWGGEVSVHWGDTPHNHEDFLSAGPWRSPEPVFPSNSWALNVGGSPRSMMRSPAPRGSDLYLEVQRMRDNVGLAAGPVWNPTAGRLGAQVTAFLGNIYLRATELDGNAVLQMGIAVKFPLTLVWSR
jgi:hypothetical protein